MDLQYTSQRGTVVVLTGYLEYLGMQPHHNLLFLLLLLLLPASGAWTVPGLGIRQRVLRFSSESDAIDIQADANRVLEKEGVLIAPALATSNVAMLGAEVENAVSAGADCIHINVMDGHFVPKMTLGPMFVKALRSYGIKAPLDVQLTAVDIVDTLIEEFAAVGANYITFHAEGSHHNDRSLSLIKSKGLKCGLVLNPSTPTSVLENVMDKVDIILLMSINPGFKGEKFNEAVYLKAQKVSSMIKESGRKIRLEIDGGANVKNIQKLAECGVDMFVVGRGVFHAENYADAITELRCLAEKGAALS